MKTQRQALPILVGVSLVACGAEPYGNDDDSELGSSTHEVYTDCNPSAPIDETVTIPSGSTATIYADVEHPYGSTNCEKRTHVKIANTVGRTFQVSAAVPSYLFGSNCSAARLSIKTGNYSCTPFPCGWKGWNGEVIFKGKHHSFEGTPFWICLTEYVSGPLWSLSWTDTLVYESRVTARRYSVGSESTNDPSDVRHTVTVYDTN